MHHLVSSHPVRAAALAVSLAAALIAVPSAAGADLCVADVPCVSSGGTAKDGIQQALQAAAQTAEPDTIHIGAGTFSGNFVYLGTSPIEIRGAGRVKTIIKPIAAGPPTYPSAIRIDQPVPSTSRVSDIGFELTAKDARGLELHDGAVAERIDVFGPSVQGLGVWMDGEGTTLGHATIDLPGVDARGVVAGTGILRDLDVDAQEAISAIGTPGESHLLLQRARVRATGTAIDLSHGRLDAQDVFVDARNSPGNAIEVRNTVSDKFSSQFVGRHLTVVGTPDFVDARGLRVEGSGTLHAATADLHESIIAGYSTAIELRSLNGGWASAAMSHSVRGPVTQKHTPAGGGAFSEQSAISVLGALGFADPAHGDFSLLPQSPLVDAGSDLALLAGESVLDVAGAARIADGDGDGVARRDIGAYERPAAVGDADEASNASAAVSGAAPTNASPVPTHLDEAARPVDPSTPGGSQGDHVAPQISKLRITAAGRGARRKLSARFSLTEGATVSATLARKVGKRWMARPGRLVQSSPAAGATAMAVPAKLAGKRLPAGRYRLVMIARDAAGNAGVAQEVTFKLG